MSSAQFEQLESLKPIPFRPTADFVVEVARAERYLQQPHDRGGAASVPDRSDHTGGIEPDVPTGHHQRLRHETGLFEGQFSGAHSEDILAAAMHYLSAEDQSYWMQRQQITPAQMGDRLLDMFYEFKTALRRVKVEDATTGEAIALQTRRSQVL